MKCENAVSKNNTTFLNLFDSLIQQKILFEETGPLNNTFKNKNLFLVLSNLFSKMREQKLQFTRIDLGSNIFHPHHNKGDQEKSSQFNVFQQKKTFKFNKIYSLRGDIWY